MRMRAARDDGTAAPFRGSVALFRRRERDLAALLPTGVRQVR